MFDLVVPVYNSMHHVRSCLFSLFHSATRPCRLVVVDDCSDSHTRAGLDELLAAGWDEMLRTLRDREPLKPSTKIDSLSPAEQTATAQQQ